MEPLHTRCGFSLILSTTWQWPRELDFERPSWKLSRFVTLSWRETWLAYESTYTQNLGDLNIMGQMGKGTKEMRSGHPKPRLNRKTHMPELLSSPSTRNAASVNSANILLKLHKDPSRLMSSSHETMDVIWTFKSAANPVWSKFSLSSDSSLNLSFSSWLHSLYLEIRVNSLTWCGGAPWWVPAGSCVLAEKSRVHGSMRCHRESTTSLHPTHSTHESRTTRHPSSTWILE